LLRGIAKIQGDMGEYASADGTYAELVRLYTALHEPRQEAWARADHADNAYQMNNPSLAATLLQQSKDVRNRPVNDAELNARFSELDGWIAISKGDPAGARELLRVARQRSGSALGADHFRTFKLGQALLRAEGQLRNVDAALTLHEELRQVAAHVKGIDASELATMDWEQVNLLQDAGRFAQALALAEATLPICIASLGADEQDCRGLLLLRGRMLLRLGLVERALRDMPRFAALAEDQKWPFVRIEAMLLQFRLASRARATSDLPSMAERVSVFGQSGAEVSMNPVFKVTALLALAESSLLLGDPQSAQVWAEQAVAKLQESGAPSTNAAFAALARELMGVALLHQGDPERALHWLTQAQSRFEANFGADHATTQLMKLNSALALDALGRRDEALAIVVRAQSILQTALGVATPAYERVKELRRRLEALPGRDVGIPSRPGAGSWRPSYQSEGSPEFFS
jgi:tetratricopeptide (TPR) repeat protein